MLVREDLCSFEKIYARSRRFMLVQRHPRNTNATQEIPREHNCEKSLS
ncbi:hypothetical protein [Fictibacillus phosphorivorans]|nr:hypothetical protein [Fictibacillus phosphorivorans]